MALKVYTNLKVYNHTYLVHVQKCSYVSNQSNEVQRRAKSIRSLIFYYIFHVKPHFLKTLFQSRLLFDFDDFFTNKNRIKCSFTL